MLRQIWVSSTKQQADVMSAAKSWSLSFLKAPFFHPGTVALLFNVALGSPGSLLVCICIKCAQNIPPLQGQSSEDCVQPPSLPVPPPMNPAAHLHRGASSPVWKTSAQRLRAKRWNLGTTGLLTLKTNETSYAPLYIGQYRKLLVPMATITGKESP